MHVEPNSYWRRFLGFKGIQEKDKETVETIERMQEICLTFRQTESYGSSEQGPLTSNGTQAIKSNIN